MAIRAYFHDALAPSNENEGLSCRAHTVLEPGVRSAPMVAPWRREGQMPTLEERVAYLEGRLGDHFAAVDEVRVTTREFRADSNRQFGEVRGETEHLRTEMTSQFGEVRADTEQLRTEMTRQFADVRGESQQLRTEMTRQFADVRGETQQLRTDMARQFGEVRAEREHLRVEMTREFAEVRVDARRLEDHLHQQFRWLVGIQVTSLLAVGSAVVGLYFK